jgi:hypothetical protein
MKLQNALRRRPLLVAALLAGCVSFAAFGIWLSVRPAAANACGVGTRPPADRQTLQERIRRGVGGEVRFGAAGDSDDNIDASVETLAQFIRRRSNMEMSEATRKELQKAEKDTLQGRRPRISLDALTDSLTAVAADRARTISDKEIDRAVDMFPTTPDGQVTLRLGDKSASVPKEELLRQVKSSRKAAPRDGSSLESAMRPFFDEEVKARADSLSEAMPEQFGRLRTEGATPAQAVLISYSVASADPLADSEADIARRTVQDRINARLTRSDAKAQRLNSPTPYGRSGSTYASPASLLFGRATVKRLLNPAQGGTGK